MSCWTDTQNIFELNIRCFWENKGRCFFPLSATIAKPLTVLNSKGVWKIIEIEEKNADYFRRVVICGTLENVLKIRDIL